MIVSILLLEVLISAVMERSFSRCAWKQNSEKWMDINNSQFRTSTDPLEAIVSRTENTRIGKGEVSNAPELMVVKPKYLEQIRRQTRS